MKKGYKYLLITLVTGLILFLVFWIIMSLTLSGPFDKTVTLEETVKNFKQRETDIMRFADHLFLNKPPQKEISLTVSGNTASFSIGPPGWAVYENKPNRHFNFKISKLDKDNPFLKELGWDAETCKDIITAFKKTNCENAMTNDDHIDLDFKSGTWSAYSYRINAVPMTDSMMIKGDTGIQVLNKRVTIGRTTAL